MISVTVKPRSDNRFDIYVHAENGELLMNSSQGYENVEDAERIAHLCFGLAFRHDDTGILNAPEWEPARLTVEYRDGRVKSEVLR